MLLVIVALVLTAALLMNGSSLAVLGILLPTLIHVSLFTLIFMVLGAFRSGAEDAGGAGRALSDGDHDPACAAARREAVPAFAKPAQDYFGNVARRSDGCSASPACGSIQG